MRQGRSVARTCRAAAGLCHANDDSVKCYCSPLNKAERSINKFRGCAPCCPHNTTGVTTCPSGPRRMMDKAPTKPRRYKISVKVCCKNPAEIAATKLQRCTSWVGCHCLRRRPWTRTCWAARHQQVAVQRHSTFHSPTQYSTQRGRY